MAAIVYSLLHARRSNQPTVGIDGEDIPLPFNDQVRSFFEYAKVETNVEDRSI